MNDFKEFTGDYEKQFYDVELPSGEIILACWPNAGFMNRTDKVGGKYAEGECKIRVSTASILS